MPRDLFGDVTRPSMSVGSRKWYTLPLSLITHSAIVLALIAIPILAPSVMPQVFADDDLAYITKLIPIPPPIPKLRPVEVDEPLIDRAVAPISAPTGFATEPDVLSDPASDAPVGLVDGAIDTNAAAVLAPPQPRPVEQAPAPVRPGGAIRTPVKTRHVAPLYTEMARIARVEGLVILEATIGVDGRVTNVRVLRSIPLLDQSAIEAVSQWEFTPTQLNGQPVPVIMTVTVNFTLR
jgi:TonB family protein